MEIAAFASFAALVVAWIALPVRSPTTVRMLKERSAEAAD